MNALTIEMVAIPKLQPWKKNAREHSRKQIDQVAASIAKFGFTFPILIDANNSILAGHARVEALKKLGNAELAIKNSPQPQAPELLVALSEAQAAWISYRDGMDPRWRDVLESEARTLLRERNSDDVPEGSSKPR